MKRILLFSMPTPEVIAKIEPLLFPVGISSRRFAYMLSDGASPENAEYVPFWEELAQKHHAFFTFIDNSIVDSNEETRKLGAANILLITGGNTYSLLNNLRKSGLDRVVVDFAKKDEFVLSGFSAGALVLTPTIKIVEADWHFGPDSNEVGLKDLTALNIIDHELLPHYNPEFDRELLASYSRESRYKVVPVTDDGFLNIEL